MSSFSWTDRPSDEFKGRKILGWVIIALTGVAVFLASNNIIFALISLVLMVFASSRFYFKTYFSADDIGMGEKFLGFSRTRKWAEFRRVDVGKRAVFLSPYETPRRMDNFRGWFVPTPSDETKNFIVAKVKESFQAKADNNC